MGIGKRGAFIRIPFSGVPEGGSLIEGGFVYTIKNEAISTGHKRNGAYIDENRKLDAIFCVKGRRDFAGPTESPPTVQLQSLRLWIAVIAYRKWDFRVTGAPMAFLRSEPLKRDTYPQLPKVADGDTVGCELSKPMYGLSTTCKDWYKP